VQAKWNVIYRQVKRQKEGCFFVLFGMSVKPSFCGHHFVSANE